MVKDMDGRMPNTPRMARPCVRRKRALSSAGIAALLVAMLAAVPSISSAGTLADNFENDSQITDGSGVDGTWEVVSTPGFYTLTADLTTAFNNGASLKVVFDKNNGQYPYFRVKGLTNTGNFGGNFGGDTFFSARIYGATTILAKFVDADKTESDVQSVTTTSSGWNLATWKYGACPACAGGSVAGMDLTKIDTILFFVLPGQTSGTGTFYLDNFWVGHGYPAATAIVSDLRVFPGPRNGQIRLTWTAVGESGQKAQKYLIRMSTSTITDATFNTATDVTDAPTPASSGAVDSMIVSNLTAGQRYFFAMKVVDPNGDTQSLSNVVDTVPYSSSAGSLLFDDFNDGYTKPNGFGKDVSNWSSGGAVIFLFTASPANSFGGIGGALGVDYITGPNSAGGYYSTFGDTDLSAYRGVSFWVRGASGGEDFLIGLKTDLNNGESKIRVRPYLPAGRISTSWQKVVIPFSAFSKLDPSAVSATNTTDPLSRMNNISFTFNGQTTSFVGEVFIDEIVFVKTVSKIYVEDFDRSTDPDIGTSNAAGGITNNLGTAGSYTRQSDGTAKLFSTAVNDGAFTTLIDNANLSQGDKSTQFMDATHLVFYAKGNVGGEALEVNFQDKHNNEKAVSVPAWSGSALPAVWTKIELPLDLFTGVDFQNMNALHFRLAAAGQTVFVDSIVFADSSSPTAPSGLLLNGSPATANASLTTRNLLSVTADAGSTDASMQEVRFEYFDGSTWTTIGVDRDVSDNNYQTVWVTRNITGAPRHLPDPPSADFPLSPSASFAPFFAGVPVNLAFRAVAVDVAGNTTATNAFTSSSINVAKVIVYPNPYYPLQGGTMKFTNLSVGAIVGIFTISGELVIQLVDSNNDGLVEWDGTNKGGDRVASGLYLYEARLTGTIAHGKLVVIK